MERESEGRIAFLDVQLKRRGTSVQTSVFCKKTHTDRYLNFNSHHHAKMFRGVIRCLTVRGDKVCDGGKQWQEIQHLRQVFRNINYSEPVVKNNLKGRPTPTNTTMESQTPPKILHLPYVKVVSECIEKSENSDEIYKHTQKFSTKDEAG